jgi:hypothetical protein
MILLMKNKSFYILFVFLSCLACFFQSCDREEAGNTGTDTGKTGTGRPMVNGEELCFANDKRTKSTDFDFEVGDEVGIYAVSRNGNQRGILKNSGNTADNKRFRFDGDQFVAVSESDKIFYEAGSILDFYVYYPYTPTIENVSAYSFTVSDDQSEDFDKNDLCWASNETGDMTNPVTLRFKHKLSQVHLRFNTGAVEKLTSAKILDIIPSASLNLQTGEIVTADKPKQSPEMFLYGKSDKTYVYRSLQPAQEIKKGATLFSFVVNDKEKEFKASEDISFKSGERHSFEFALQYKISVEAHGEGSVYGSGIFAHGESVTVYGHAYPDWYLIGWFEDGVLVCDQQEYTFEATKDRHLLVKYGTMNNGTITTRSTGGGSTEGGGIYPIDEACTVKATEYPSYYFSGWYEKGLKVSSSKEYSFRVTGDRELEARFSPSDVYVEVKFIGRGTGTNADGPLAYGAAKIIAYYYRDGKKYDYYPGNGFNVYISFTYTAGNPQTGAFLGNYLCFRHQLKAYANSDYHMNWLFYWDNATISSNRMTDLVSIENMRLDRSADQSSRYYYLRDETVSYYREKLWVSEDNYPLIKTLTNKRNSNY